VEAIHHLPQNAVTLFLFAYPKYYSKQHQNEQYNLFPLTKKKMKKKRIKTNNAEYL
jgi:hypothetical protein